MASLALDLRRAPEVAGKILIADDQADVLEALRLLLKGHGYQVSTVQSPAAVVSSLAAQPFDLLLMDLNYARDTTSGREGLDLLGKIRELDERPPIVVMTGWASIDLAVETMQHGVCDFVQKPWQNTRLLEIIRTQVEKGRTERQQRIEEQEARRRGARMELEFQHHEEEIAEARKIQQGLLPVEFPQVSGVQVAGTWLPARVVSGDYFDVLKFGERSLGLCIADVAGKGLPAALLMSNLQAAVRSLASGPLPADVLVAKVDALVTANLADDRFITFFYARFDGNEMRLHYVNAGHNPPILLHADGSCERLLQGGGVLGRFGEKNFAAGQAQLRAGDRLILFTDGITEACNGEGEEFGEARLLSLLTAHRQEPAQGLKDAVLAAVRQFAGESLEDDATLIVLAAGL